ncbi:hypothetical protein P8452_73081 [Trifolium repens]|nr:hypothetical protein P8452_73081 [Trifolium repens]
MDGKSKSFLFLPAKREKKKQMGFGWFKCSSISLVKFSYDSTPSCCSLIRGFLWYFCLMMMMNPKSKWSSSTNLS